MALVNRLLDVFFRTLDAVDVARERIDRALGRGPRPEPWTSEWHPAPEAERTGSSAEGPELFETPGQKPAAAPVAPTKSKRTDKSDKSAKTGKAPRATTSAKPAADKARPKKAAPRNEAPRRAEPTPSGGKKAGGGNRKGSVDRSGKDFDSPRAKAIVEKLKSSGQGVITEDASLEGKRVLARVLWALAAADQAGSELGLTAADASALLHLAAGVEVFATNVARTCRDESALIEESSPDGRSKRYKLTAAGRVAANKLPTRALEGV